MKNEYCVYMHTAPNGKKYVGITCCHPRNRRWQNGYGYSEQQIFYNAIRKYGWNSFEHTILEDNLTAEEAGEAERKYIALYQTTDRNYGYNYMVGGEVGYHLTDEQKKKISYANSGSKNGMYGHHYTDEERKKMSETSVWRGRKHSEETIKKLVEYHKLHPNKPRYGKNHPQAKAVIQYDLNGKYIQRFDTAAEAESKTGILRSCICTCVKGKNKTAGGYIWRYEGKPLSLQDIEKTKHHNWNSSSITWKIKKVNQCDANGRVIATFNSVKEAQNAIGKPNGSSISAVCKGKRKTAGGYIWKYAE